MSNTEKILATFKKEHFGICERAFTVKDGLPYLDSWFGAYLIDGKWYEDEGKHATMYYDLLTGKFIGKNTLHLDEEVELDRIIWNSIYDSGIEPTIPIDYRKIKNTTVMSCYIRHLSTYGHMSNLGLYIHPTDSANSRGAS